MSYSLDNDERGIQFIGGARGLARNNIVERNRYSGILVDGEGATATLRNNQCRENYHSGILFSQGAGGEATGNTCENNPWSGIAVRGKGTNPTLTANRCNNNGAWGIIYWAGAGPSITKDNVAVGNGKEGIMQRD